MILDAWDIIKTTLIGVASGVVVGHFVARIAVVKVLRAFDRRPHNHSP